MEHILHHVRTISNMKQIRFRVQAKQNDTFKPSLALPTN